MLASRFEGALAESLHAPGGTPGTRSLTMSLAPAAAPRVQLKRDGDSAAPPVRGAPAAALIVDDDADAAPGQLRKSDYLGRLRAAVLETASGVLGPTWNASECADIPRIFGHYASLDAAAVERVMRRYARQASAVSAVEYVAAACARLAGTIARWGAGEELSWDLGASGLPAAIEPDAGAAPAASPVAAASPIAAAAVQLKAAGPGARASVDPANDLGPGAAIDGATAARMGTAFGDSFADVRIHTEAVAANKTRELGAHAMAMGNHVAFAPGEYQPGTETGDGLIAHELAHVLQQRGSAPVLQQRAVDVDTSSAHERDADDAAASVIARLYPTPGSEPEAATPIRPNLSTGLGVQRGNRPEEEKKEKKKPANQPVRRPPPRTIEDPNLPKGVRPQDFWAANRGFRHLALDNLSSGDSTSSESEDAPLAIATNQQPLAIATNQQPLAIATNQQPITTTTSPEKAKPEVKEPSPALSQWPEHVGALALRLHKCGSIGIARELAEPMRKLGADERRLVVDAFFLSLNGFSHLLADGWFVAMLLALGEDHCFAELERCLTLCPKSASCVRIDIFFLMEKSQVDQSRVARLCDKLGLDAFERDRKTSDHAEKRAHHALCDQGSEKMMSIPPEERKASQKHNDGMPQPYALIEFQRALAPLKNAPVFDAETCQTIAYLLSGLDEAISFSLCLGRLELMRNFLPNNLSSTCAFHSHMQMKVRNGMSDPFIIPTGNDGHATMLLFSNDSKQKNTYELTHYNTGDGVEGRHPEKELDGKLKYQTFVRLKQVTRQMLQEQGWKGDFWTRLIASKLGYYMSAIYDLMKDMQSEGAENDLLNPEIADCFYELKQSSGTCTWQSLMAMLRHQIILRASDKQIGLHQYKLVKLAMSEGIYAETFAVISNQGTGATVRRIATATLHARRRKAGRGAPDQHHPVIGPALLHEGHHGGLGLLEGQPAEHKAVEEKPTEEKPGDEKAVEDKAGDGQPTEIKPAEEKPTEIKPTEIKPTEDKAGEGDGDDATTS